MQINGNEEDDHDVKEISRDDISSDAARVMIAEKTMNDEKEKIMKELEIIKTEKRRALLREKLEQARIERTIDFRIASISITSRIADMLQRKKLFKKIDSKKYKKINQHDLNIFTRECNDEFEIKFYIYAEDRNRILIAQRYLESISTND
jgi:hypothetical protein